jgi:hypothetical protein
MIAHRALGDRGLDGRRGRGRSVRRRCPQRPASAPVSATELAVAAKVNDGTMTSSPARTPLESRPRCRPEVPELTATHARPRPKCALNSSSKALTSGPCASMPERITRSPPRSPRRRQSAWRGDEVVHGQPPSGSRRSLDVCRLSGLGAHPLSPVRVRPPGAPRPARPSPILRAGTPATSAKSGTSLTTTDPAATSAQRPIVTGATHTERAPIEAPVQTGDADGLPVVAALELTVRRNRPGEVIVGEAHRGADEDAVPPAGRARRPVRSSAACSCRPSDAGADIGPAADDAVLPEDGALADLREMPDGGVVANRGLL